jgi:CRP-like cAMP-binding protein
MYEHLFNNEKQIEMRNYFIQLSETIGKTKCYKKNELISFNEDKFVGIVKKGVLSKSIVSSKGKVHALFLLRKGEILGETYYFCGGENVLLIKAKEYCEIAFIENDLLTNELIKNPVAYKYFIHSITRKYRIIMLQLTNSVFNDSFGKIADALLRLATCADMDPLGRVTLNIPFTHQELADNIGCSRVTVTNCLKEFLDKEIISYDNKKIVLNDTDALKKYIDILYD